MSVFTEYQYKNLILNGLSPMALNNKPFAHIIRFSTNEEWLVSELYEDNKTLACGIYYKHGMKPEFKQFDITDWDDSKLTNSGLFNDIAFHTEYKIAVFDFVAKEIGQLETRPQGYEKEFEQAIKHTLG